MCASCVVRLGGPVEWTDRMREVKEMYDIFYETYCTGGALHAWVDDLNLDDNRFGPDRLRLVIEFYDKYYREENGDAGLDETLRLYFALERLTEAQRVTVCGTQEI